MSFESPFSVIYNSVGVETTVTGANQQLDPVSQSFLLIGGSSSFGEGAQAFRTTNDGAQFVTGAVSIDSLPSITIEDGLIVDQGVHGDASSSWYMVITDGTSSQALGAAEAGPLWITGTVDTNGPNGDSDNPIFVTGSLTISQSCNFGSDVSSVTATTLIATLREINGGRKGALLYYNGNKTAFVKLGNSASQTDFSVRMSARSYYEVPGDYCGIVTATWDNASQPSSNFMQVTEITE